MGPRDTPEVTFTRAAAQPGPPAVSVRQRLLRGNYAEALAGYLELTKGNNPPVSAFVGLAQCHREQGEYVKARDALDAGLKTHPDNPELLERRADLLFSLGQWDAASKDAEAALTKDAKSPLARWTRARLLRDAGDLEAADKDVRQLVKEYTDAAAAGKPIDPDALHVFAQAGIENAITHGKHPQLTFVLQELLPDALKADPDFWPADALAGQLLLDKHNRAEAAGKFDAALKINPKATEALVGKGRIALERVELADAERLADLALKVNPQHVGALRLKADVRLAEADAPAAEKLLRAAKAVNPRDEATLARLAGLQLLAGHKDVIATATKEVEAFNAKPGVFFAELGQLLADARRFGPAAECFEKAIAVRPTLPAPRAGLGMLLYLQGREPEARAALTAAMKADPFNLKADNALKVLDELAKYETLETKHFTIRFDPRNDKVFAAFLADALEVAHADLSKQYGSAPGDKILVEVFARREAFSGRIAALPGIPGAVQGASTGPLIALPSPRADGAPKLYNWEVVARHELTHAFNLLRTRHQCPIWLTEGLAVRAEGTKRFGSVVPLLRDRLAAGTAFNLDTIARAYKRFGQPADVMLAYYQGYLYVEYIAQTHGEPAVARLLDSFRDGADVPTALKSALGAEKATFEAEYRAFAEKTATAAAPRRPDPPMTFAELEAAHRKNPDDRDAAARLAAEYLRRDRPADARKLCESILKAEPEHPLAAVVLARILSRAKDAGGAAKLLDAVAAKTPDSRVLLELGRLHLAAKDYERAAGAFEKGLKVAPAEGDWLEQLARVYDSAKRPDELARVLTELTAASPDDVLLQIRLAKLHANAKRPAQAAEAARRALHIDVLNPEAREVLLVALQALGRDAEREELLRRFR